MHTNRLPKGLQGTFPGGLEDREVCSARWTQRRADAQLRMTALEPVGVGAGRMRKEDPWGIRYDYRELPRSPPGWCCRLKKNQDFDPAAYPDIIIVGLYPGSRRKVRPEYVSMYYEAVEQGGQIAVTFTFVVVANVVIESPSSRTDFGVWVLGHPVSGS